jgi:glutathione S-transferase
MTLTLYDLVGKDDRRFSPYCWRTRMALAHKGLDVEVVPCKFTEKDKIAFSGQGLVPVLVDGDTTVHDSWAIAVYLEETYPDRPSLFGGAVGRGVTLAFTNWVTTQLHPPLMRVIIGDVLAHVHPDDAAYFQSSRETRFGTTIAAMHAARDSQIDALKAALQPAELTLAAQDFICGAAPAYGDYVLFGAMQWMRSTSPLRISSVAGEKTCAWLRRICGLYDGLADSVPHYPL